MITQSYKLNIVPHAEQNVRGFIAPVVHESQYDTGMRTLIFTLYKEGELYTILEGQTVSLFGTKPDGNAFEYSMTIDDEHTVSIVDNIQMTCIAGLVTCEIVVFGTQNDRIGSANFVLCIEPAAVDADQVLSDTDIPVFNEILYGGEVGEILTKTNTGAEWAPQGTGTGYMIKAEYDPNDTGSVLKADHADDAGTVDGFTVARNVLADEYTNAQIDTMVQGAGKVKTVNTVQPDQSGNVQITKTDIGLGNVDNTSDASKPISTATQAALDLKVDKVDGKGLSSNDYTDADKTKLGDLPTAAELTADLSGKVDKETGKGLSTNDYTTADKDKLAGIAAGAEVNVQSDWNEADSTADDYIKNKPTIPAKTSDLQNDSGFITGVAWGGIAGTIANQTDLKNELDAKQGKLTAGSNITIDQNNVISASGGTGTGGHVIVNSSGTDMAQRAKLKFDGATVTDDSVNDMTIVSGLKGDPGDPGDPGTAATIAVGTVVSGQTASVTNSGTSTAAVFDFVLPKGDPGTPGADGHDGQDGAAATIAVGSVTSGQTASVVNSGTSSAAVFDFVLPKGDPGTPGQDGSDGADGVSPTVSTSAITGGTAVVITDAQGPHTFNVMNGINGQDGAPGADGSDGSDGFSPVVTTSSITGGTEVTITDAIGPHVFDVMNGATGQTGQTGPAGADGYSPTATVTKTGSTATITITDKNGTTTATVSDGSDVSESNLATIETSPVTHAYSEGDYLVYNGLLYKVTAAIAIGESLTVGTNIESTKVGDELSSLNSNNVYSLMEQKTGETWIDGKPIYKKTWEFSNVPNGNTGYSANISNVDNMVKYEAFGYANSFWNPLNYANLDFQYTRSFYFRSDDNKIYFAIGNGSGAGFEKAIITLYYTKTTD